MRLPRFTRVDTYRCKHGHTIPNYTQAYLICYLDPIYWLAVYQSEAGQSRQPYLGSVTFQLQRTLCFGLPDSTTYMKKDNVSSTLDHGFPNGSRSFIFTYFPVSKILPKKTQLQFIQISNRYKFTILSLLCMELKLF